MTRMLLINCEYNAKTGRTCLYDSRSGTILFEATEAAADFLEDVSDVGIKIAMACGEIETELLDESEHISVQAYVVEPDYATFSTKVYYECLIGYATRWDEDEDALRELVLDHYLQEHEASDDAYVELVYYKTVEV
jgi:hypothetical protein